MIAPDLARALEEAGVSAEVASARASRLRRVLSALASERRDMDTWAAWFVPGRIEVLGKHTDYGGGRSLICAAERGFDVVSAPRADGRVALTDLGRGARLMLDLQGPPPAVSWATYPLTVLRRLSRNFPEMRRGIDLVFESDLPSAAGMSSSSALMIAVLLALVRANRLDTTAAWTGNLRNGPEDLAAYAATIENGRTFRGLIGEGGVGTEGGSEDHTAILCSEPSQVGQYAFCPTRRERSIPLSHGLVFVIGVSGVAASKTGEARDDYNRASRIAGQVFERWLEVTGRRDESLAAAMSSSDDAADRLRAMLRGDQDLLDRFDQFHEESTRLVPTAARSARARRLGRIRCHGGAVAGPRRTAAAEPGAGDGSARQDGARARRMGGVGLRRGIWRQRVGAHRAVPRPRVPRSLAECVCCRVPVGRRALAVLPDQARAGGRRVE